MEEIQDIVDPHLLCHYSPIGQKLEMCTNFGQGDHTTTISSLASTSKNTKSIEKLTVNRVVDKQSLFTEQMSIHHVALAVQDLPNHLLKHIFSFLDVEEKYKIESVCRKWRLIIKLLPWTEPTILSFTGGAKDSTLGIPSFELTDEMLLSLLFRCRMCLKEVRIVFEPIDYVTLTEKSVFGIGKYCVNLEKLKLWGVPVNTECLKAVANGCGNLKEFDVFTFKNCYEYEDGVLEIVRNCASLEKLFVSDLFLCDDWFSVVNRNLKVLSLRNIILPPMAVDNLITNCSGIQELNLCFCPETEMKSLFKIFDHFKTTLRKLKMCLGCSVKDDIDWFKGLKYLTNLDELQLCFGASVNDSVLEFIIKNCTQLRVLGIPGSNVTDRSAIHLKALANLKQVDVSCNRHLSDKGLEPIAKCGNLEEVYVCCVPSISEGFCCSLAKNCPNLNILDASANKKITNRLVTAFRVAVQKRCPSKPVKLVIGRTSVSSAKIKRCPGLEVQFACRYDDFLPSDGVDDKIKIKFKVYNTA